MRIPAIDTSNLAMAATADRPLTSRADSDMPLRDTLRELLESVRERTLLLMSPVSEEDARIQHDPLMSPIVWDLGHISSFERLWLQEQLDRAVAFGEMPGLYNPFEHPRASRADLPLPTLRAALDELARVRDATVERLDRVSFDTSSQLLRDGYVYRMVAQHESQHQETILQTLQLKRGEPYPAPRAWPPPFGSAAKIEYGTMARFPGGDVVVGTDDTSAAYDNERPAHVVTLAPFDIDVTPVINAEYLEFVEEGGYHSERLWSDAGRVWLAESGATAPKYWRPKGNFWLERHMDDERLLQLDRPVCHVCYHEADAYARWAGKRLPTEEEWEAAATWNPISQVKQSYPWGDEPPTETLANVDQLLFSTAAIGAYGRNVSPIGCYGMIGDVWEWTSSDFRGYPGFRAFPYREYSQVFFGSEYKVLRGGSWATAPHVARSPFRNWDFPIRRQIFSGFRCARDA